MDGVNCPLLQYSKLRENGNGNFTLEVKNVKIDSGLPSKLLIN